MAKIILFMVIMGFTYLMTFIDFNGLFGVNLPETNSGFTGNSSAILELSKVAGIGVLIALLVAWVFAKLAGTAPRGRGYSRPYYPRSAPRTITRVNANPYTYSTMNSPQTGTLRSQKWHGTPTINNALDIMQNQGSWIVGNGNANGTGVYLASKSIASGYTSSTGGLIRVNINIPRSQVADYGHILSSIDFRAWRRSNGTRNHGDDLSEYIITQLDQRYLDAGGGIIVALVRSADKQQLVKIEGLTAVAAYDLRGNKIA